MPWSYVYTILLGERIPSAVISFTPVGVSKQLEQRTEKGEMVGGKAVCIQLLLFYPPPTTFFSVSCGYL